MEVNTRNSPSDNSSREASVCSDPAAYAQARQEVLDRERSLAFDHDCRARASADELVVDEIITYLRRRDAFDIFQPASPRQGYGGQLHSRFPGDHFLSNVDLIERTALLHVARLMPKGAHLHIHFNACLLPNVLLDIAKDMERMFISSDIPLISEDNFQSFAKCEIRFSIRSVEQERPGDIFDCTYESRRDMHIKDFLRNFPKKELGQDPNSWLLDKLVFSEVEVHNHLQTAAGTWQKFNGRTRMMKGLFNYETAYKRYTRLCLENFVADNIQYAEIRPNFMITNQLYTDDGSATIDNSGIVQIIISETEKFQQSLAGSGRYFFGIKIIYCTPRSFSSAQVQCALDECFQFKQRWPEWIAGFDLVGEEGAGKPLKEFVPALLDFQRRCSGANLQVPFLFHCGETLDLGSDTDENLVDALLLNSRRIGHGYALTRHPYILEQMKARGVCLELCPISNEILGLTPRIAGHSLYELLAKNVRCTVSSDNGTFFRSSLSHDFYQLMVGKQDFGLFGWKQLVLWSIEHACLEDAERAKVTRRWDTMWQAFLREVKALYEGEWKRNNGATPA